jgi:hypothetical protein
MRYIILRQIAEFKNRYYLLQPKEVTAVQGWDSSNVCFLPSRLGYSFSSKVSLMLESDDFITFFLLLAFGI